MILPTMHIRYTVNNYPFILDKNILRYLQIESNIKNNKTFSIR